MTTHAIFTATITKPDNMAQYREHAAQALAKHGGAVLQASTSVTVLDGGNAAPSIVAVLSFPDVDAANAWHSDPELAHVHDLRRGAGSTSLVLLT